MPVKMSCLVCNYDEPSLRPLDVREPRGFFTSLQPEDFEGQFEWQPRSTRPSLSIDPHTGVPANQIGNCSVRTFKEHILSINDNGGKGSFDFQAAKIFNQTKPGAYAVSLDPEDASSPEASLGQNVSTSGPSWRIALGSRRMTDVLLVNIDNWPRGVFADPTSVEGRAAWYSFAFWLRLAAGAHLDVDALEMQAGFRSLPDVTNQVIGQAFLCDQLENGAGYSWFLGQATEFQKLLEQGNPARSNSIAAKWIGSTTSSLQASPVHGAECDTSCNLCLRDFHNAPYHGLLDWRLALDMARLATADTAKVDLASSWGGLPILGRPWFRTSLRLSLQ